MKFQIALTTAVVMASSGHAQDTSDFSFAPPTAPAESRPLWATHYFVHAAPSVSTGIAFRDKSGGVISDRVSPRDWCLAAIEGTVQVQHNGVPKTLNYGGIGAKSHVDCASVLKISPVKKPWITKTGRSYFGNAGGPFGDGVKGYRLVPFRTVAVDNKFIPYGTVLFISKARGVKISLPSGASATHDGYFFAADTGGAIKGNHIDVFCGVTPENCFPGFVTSDEAKTFDASVVGDTSMIKTFEAMHRK